MLVSELIANVRDILQDVEGVRYKTDSLLRTLNLSILHMRNMAPQHFIGTFSDEPFQATSVDDVLRVPNSAIPALTDYVIGRAELRDDEYTTDGRAEALLKKADDAGGVQ